MNSNGKSAACGARQTAPVMMLPGLASHAGSVGLPSSQDTDKSMFIAAALHHDFEIRNPSDHHTSVCEAGFHSRACMNGSGCGKKLRSLSSLMRVEEVSSDVARSVCSPSVKPPVSGHTPSPSTAPAPAPALLPASAPTPLSLLNSIGDGPNRRQSYFSAAPPSEPLRLVLFPAQKARKTIGARETLRNRRRVRSLLRDIIAQLPEGRVASQGLPTTTAADSHPTVSLRRLSKSSGSRSRALSDAAAADCRHVATAADPCHSIAVQAHETAKAIDASRNHEDERKQCGGGGVVVGDENIGGTSGRACVDEWVGGVRALRDSHVRLVVRQLRHIELLNRTLDQHSHSAAAGGAAGGAARVAPASLNSRASSASPASHASHQFTSPSSIF